MLRVFLRLGVTSFGGPIAHLGYFRAEAVARRGWMTDAEYADLVALSQFLPGPASSQVGFGIGLHRAGMRGALAAFAGFTLPSAMLMVTFAFGASWFSGTVAEGVLLGLGIVAVAIVAQAVLGMARTLAPDRQRASIAVVAAAAALLIPFAWGQLAAIVFGALAGLLVCRGQGAGAAADSDDRNAPARVTRVWGAICLAVFALIFVAAPLLAHTLRESGFALFDAFYRAGSLVFGGGHVVLPLLQSSVVESGWVPMGTFLEGYGAAQAVPGPLFTFAAHLGAASTVGPGGALGALIALAAIFLPGFLLLLGVLPFWHSVRERIWARSAMYGANAAVVGVLAGALYTPVFTSAITGVGPFVLALACFVLLIVWKLPPWTVVVAGAAGGVLLAYLA